MVPIAAFPPPICLFLISVSPPEWLVTWLITNNVQQTPVDAQLMLILPISASCNIYLCNVSKRTSCDWRLYQAEQAVMTWI